MKIHIFIRNLKEQDERVITNQFMMMVNKKIVASCVLYFFLNNPSLIILSEVYVNEKERGKGYANKLLEFCIKYAKNEMKGTQLWLWCLKHNFVCAWYKRKGFKYVKYKDDFNQWLRMKL